MSQTLLFIYEPEQVEEVVDFVGANPETRIVALDAWAEEGLREKGISFESSRAYALSDDEQDALFEQAQRIAREWYRIPEMEFFTHQGVRIAEALESNFDNYIQCTFRYLHLMERALIAHPGVGRVVVPYSQKGSSPFAPLLPFQFNCPVHIAECLSQKYSFKVETLGTPSDVATPPQAVDPDPLSHRFLLAALNALAAVLPRKRRKFLAAEDWTHIRSFMEKMDDTELVLTDKSELRKMSWRSFIGHRVRIRRVLGSTSRAAGLIADEQMRAFRNAWKDARPAVERLPDMQRDSYSLSAIIGRAFDFAVETYARRVVVDIENAAEVLRHEKIDTVLLRASVSAQHHFFVLARVAHSLGIPSIEIQHAGAVLDPRSVHSRLEASYLAAFGSLTCEEYAKRYDMRRLRPIGAPRFDHYFPVQHPSADERAKRLRELGLDPTLPVLLIVVPKEGPELALAPWHPTSYDVAALFEEFAAMYPVFPNIQFLFKFKKNGCADFHRRYLRKHLPTQKFGISEADLFSTILLSDYVVSSNSTALYESIIAEKPVVLVAWQKDAYHDPVYGRMGPITRTADEMIDEVRMSGDPEYRRTCLQRQKEFVDENYRFDGHAYERMLRLLEGKLQLFPIA